MGLSGSNDTSRVLKALARSQAMIEFDLKANVLTANETFFNAFGYRLDEIVGKHHSMFCDPATVSSAEYGLLRTS